MAPDGVKRFDKSNIEAILPLSALQSSMLVYALDDRQDDPNISHSVMCLDGHLDRGDLQRALNHVVSRHQALRLSIQTAPDQRRFAVIAKAANVQIDWLTCDAEADAQSTLDHHLEADRQTGFDLAEAPLLRMAVVQTPSDQAWLIGGRHGIALDNWSWSTVMQDLVQHYVRLRGGAVDALPRPVSMQDVLRWQKAQEIPDRTSLWSEHLRDAPDSRIGPHVRRGGAAERIEAEVALDHALADSIKSAAARNKVSVATFMTTAWGCLIARALQQDDAVVSTNVSGRPHKMPGHEKAVGAFSETQPRRIRLQGAWGAILSTVQTASIRLQECSYIDYATGHRQDHPVAMPEFDTRFALEGKLIDLDRERFDIDGGLTIRGHASVISSVFAFSAAARISDDPCLAIVGAGGVTAEDCNAALEAFRQTLVYLVDHPSDAELDLAALQHCAAPLTAQFQDSAAETDVTSAGSNDDQERKLASNLAELQIVKIWQEVLGAQNIDTTLEFGELGGKSVAVLRMLAMVEDRLGVRVPLRDFVLNPTVAYLANAASDTAETGSTWKMLLPIQPNGTRPPLHFIHMGGSHVLFLRGLAKHLGPDQPLYGYQSIGLDGKDAPLDRFDAIVDVLLPELLSVQPEGPYFIFGHCEGARLAHALTQRLEAQGKSVGHLIMMVTMPPGALSRPKSRDGVMVRQVWRLATGKWLSIARAARVHGEVALRAVNAKVLQVVEPLRLKYGTAWHRQQVYNAQVHRAAVRADLTYAGGTVTAPIHMFECADKSADLERWSEHTTALTATQLPAPYYEAFFEPYVALLSEAIQDVLAGSQAAPDETAQAEISRNS